MSVFTNPASRGAENAAAYVAAVLELLGDHDPIAVMRETPTRLAELLTPLSPERARAPEAPGKWSVVEVLAHLADAELVFGYRLRSILTEERPRQLDYDQDAWATRLEYQECAPVASLELFRAIRGGNLALIHRITVDRPEMKERVAIHPDRGEVSLGKMLRLAAGHDLLHLRQIDRIIRTHAQEQS